MIAVKNNSTNWPIVELGKAVEFLDHLRKPVTKSDRKDGPYPYYGANGQQGTVDGYIFDEPLVLLAEDGGNFGSREKPVAYKITGKTWVNNHAHVLRPRKMTDIDYLRRVLSFYNVMPYVNGATRLKLTKGNASRMPIPLPSLAIQKKISAILEKADQACRKRQEALRLTDQFLQAAFIKMFGDPIKNPKGWKVTTFGKAMTNIRYGTGSPPPYQDKGMPFIMATNIKNGTVQDNKIRYISLEASRDIAKCRVKAGDLIIVRSGVNAGDCGLIPSQYDGAFAAYDLIVELPYPNAVYYNHLINSPFGKTQLAPLKRRAGQPHLNAEQICSLRFPSPSEAEKIKFVELVGKVEAFCEKQRQSKQELETLFQSLMQRAFGGELVF